MSSRNIQDMENTMMSNLPANRSRTTASTASAASTKQEEKKSNVATSRKRYRQYDWVMDFEAAGIVAIPTLNVGRVIENGKIEHVINLSTHGPENYIIYDGTDVVACVRDRLKTFALVNRLAKLHIGRAQDAPNPESVAVDVDYENLTRAKDDQRWVIYIHPKAGSGAKKVKTN